MLYQGLQYCYYKEDQQEVCRTTLLSLCKAQCQVESHEVHDFLFFCTFNQYLSNSTRSYVK